MRYISLFSGIEAASVAWHGMGATMCMTCEGIGRVNGHECGPCHGYGYTGGWEPVAFSEVAPFQSAVLAHHFPWVPNVGDITAHDWTQYEGKVDLVVGGSPCQAFSIAGLRGGLNDDRGNLALAFVRAVRQLRPRWVVYENVPGMLSDATNAFGCLLAGMAGADAPLLPPAGGWANAGFVSGEPGGYGCSWRVLNAEHFGVPQRRKRIFLVAHLGDWKPAAQVLFEPKSGGWNAQAGGQGRARHPRQTAGGSEPIAFKFRAGVELDYKGRQAGKGYLDSEKAFTVGASQDQYVAVFDGATEARPIVVSSTAPHPGVHEGVSPALRANGGSGGGNVPMVVASAQARAEICEGKSPTILIQNDGPPFVVNQGVRRLTPRECERLMGFPDDYTRIPYRGKPAESCPDTGRYKSLGNSIVVNVLRWIGERIQMVEEEA